MKSKLSKMQILIKYLYLKQYSKILCYCPPLLWPIPAHLDMKWLFLKIPTMLCLYKTYRPFSSAPFHHCTCRLLSSVYLCRLFIICTNYVIDMPLQILFSTGLIKTCFSGKPIKQEVAYFISSFAYNKAQTVISPMIQKDHWCSHSVTIVIFSTQSCPVALSLCHICSSLSFSNLSYGAKHTAGPIFSWMH